MIDKFSSTPVYLQIESIISEKIASGELQPGQIIPSEIDLSNSYNVSRMTARKAVDYLARQGIVERRRGLGTYVSPQAEKVKFELPLDQHMTSSEIARESHAQVCNRVIILQRRSASELCRKLMGLNTPCDIWYMERLRLIDNTPFVFEKTEMRLDCFEDLTEEVLNQSKYAYLESKGFQVKGSKKNINAELPPREVRDILGIRREEPVLHAFSQAFFENNETFEVSHVYYNQQHYTFSINAIR